MITARLALALNPPLRAPLCHDRCCWAAALLALVSIAAMTAPAEAQIFPAPGDETEVPVFDPVAAPDAGIEATTSETSRSVTTRISTTISDRISQALRVERSRDGEEDEARGFGRRGLARDGEDGFLGDAALSGWTTASLTFLENDGAGTEFDGEVMNPLVGIDATLEQSIVVGIALGYEGADLDTTFNGGTLDSDGFIITPYAGTRVGDFVVVDGGFGYARVSYDRARFDGAGTVTGDFDGDRFFVFANVAGYVPPEILDVEGLQVIGRLGFRYSHEDQSSFVENGQRIEGDSIELGQVSFGAEAKYFPDSPFDGDLELFVKAIGTVDAIRSDRAPVAGFPDPSDDRTDVRLGLGAVADVTDRLSVDIAYEHVFSREDISEQSIIAGLRYRF
ncbi:MAG: autotransporter outer membrane beta-barrel domain-containing protein [Pseudomonadota bacterium]